MEVTQSHLLIFSFDLINLNLVDKFVNRFAREIFSSARNQISKGKFFKKLNISTNSSNLFEFDVSYAFNRFKKG